MTDEQNVYCEMCGDNRFELVKKYKRELTEHTNIETSKDEMEVIESVLLRFWQMGWLGKLEDYNHQKAEIINRTEEYNDMLEQRNRCEEGIKFRELEIKILEMERNELHKIVAEQKAEIERLEAQHREMCIGMKVLKRNAVKKFAERLKEKASRGFWDELAYVDVDDIDNLVKEMVGEEDV